jgi:hypothetical protein
MIIPTLLRLSEFIRLVSCLVDFTKSRVQYGADRPSIGRGRFSNIPLAVDLDCFRPDFALRLVSGSWLSGIGVLPLSNLWRLQAGRAKL